MTPRSESLYRRVLGADFERLPKPIQEMHGATAAPTAAPTAKTASAASGRCDIDRGRHPVSRLIGFLFRMPPGGRDLPVSVTFEPQVRDGRTAAEIWRRVFDGHRMTSVMTACPRAPGHVIERFGPLACRLAVPVTNQGLSLVLREARFLGVPLPKALWPEIEASERVVDGLFAFDVSIRLPLIGVLVHYRGRLRPA